MLRRYGLDGSILSHQLATRPSEALAGDTALRMPDGSILALGATLNATSLTYHLMRGTDELRSFSVATPALFEALEAPARLLRRADGSLVAATAVRDRGDIERVAYRSSLDGGLTWGPTRYVRPNGGNGQTLAAIGEDGAGGLYTVHQDNNLMRAFVEGEDRRFGYLSTRDFVLVWTPSP